MWQGPRKGRRSVGPCRWPPEALRVYPPGMEVRRNVGPFRLIERLGRGGMAEVWLAVAYGASGFEKRVALKVALPELMGEGTCERLLIEEARLGARLSHRNLVGVHDLGVDDGVYWVRLELVEGRDLAALIQKGPMPPSLALFVAEELALALEYLHSVRDEQGRPLGLVHRDVSPANVLVSRSGEVKLGDLGIAKATLMRDQTRAGVRKGKYAYMSPEQVRGGPLLAQSDQFSLGILVSELLTGRRPFDGATPVETMDRIREAEAPDLDGLEGGVREIVLRCLRRDPGARFSSAGELAAALSMARRQLPPAGPGGLGAWCQERLEAT